MTQKISCKMVSCGPFKYTEHNYEYTEQRMEFWKTVVTLGKFISHTDMLCV